MARLRQRNALRDDSDTVTQTSQLSGQSNSFPSIKTHRLDNSIPGIATPVLSVQSNSSPIHLKLPTNSAPGVATPVPLVLGNSSATMQPKSPFKSVPDVATPVLSLQEDLEEIINCDNPDFNMIANWAKCHNGDIMAALMEVNQSSRASFSSFHCMDVDVQEKLLPAFTLRYVPVYTTGSGNCMYNMLSLAPTGTEQCMSHLRLLTACSLITNWNHTVEVIQPTAHILLPQNK